MSMNKIPYEISLWDDGLDKKEEKLCILGASNSTFEGRSINNKFITNINGSHTLTFDIPKRYFDYSIGEMVENQIVKEIFNESKIKLKFDGEWYELVVKNIEETHQGKELYFSYTCIDSYIVELSSQGYTLIFGEEELDENGNNDIGQEIDHFGEKIFKNSGWEYISANEDEFIEKITETSFSEDKQTLEEKEKVAEIPITKVEERLGRVVTKYKDGEGNSYWGYETTETLTLSSCKNMITNSSDFSGTTCWSTENNKISFAIVSEEEGEENVYYLKAIPNSTSDYLINDSTETDSPLSIKETYIIKLDFPKSKTKPTSLNVQLVESTSEGEEPRYIENLNGIESGKYYAFKPQHNYNGFIIKIFIEEETWLKSIMLFRAVANVNGENKTVEELENEINSKKNTIDNWKFSDGALEEEIESILLPDSPNNYPVVYKNNRTYYYKDNNNEELEYVNGDSSFKIVYDENGNKRRSLITDKSNRFNLCQDVAELFEGWPRFIINHDEQGNIIGKKQVKFVEKVGQDNGYGFHYSTNLNNVTRTINSEQIVTKMYVENIEADYTDAGLVSIQLADKQYNPSGENFLINLNYFATFGKINISQYYNDLYGTTSDSLGYFKNLKEYNKKIEEYQSTKAEIDKTYRELAVKKDTLEISIDSAKKEIDTNNSYFIEGVTATEKQKSEAKEKNKELNRVIKELQKELDILTPQVDNYNMQSEMQEKLIEHYTEKKKELHNNFNEKYKDYIREGVWKDDNYTSHDAYCIDALKTLQRSCYPEVSYTMTAVNLTANEDYKDWKFKVGDYTYVIDEEIFGINPTTKSPNKENVTLTEIAYDLDLPQNTEITIQNFKTQFEDLFSKIAAAAQTVQFKDAIFTRAGESFNTNGEIKVNILENTLKNNIITLAAASDQSVLIDGSGIQVKDIKDNNRIVRIVNSGIFLTSDGGNSWTTGITGNGINANCITSGYINTSKLAITDLGVPTFVWDSNGITAYKVWSDGNSVTAYDNQFVRLDQHGLYFVNKATKAFDDVNGQAWWKDNNKTVEERAEIIRNNSALSLTWLGLRIHSDNGSVDISTSDNNIVIHNEDKGYVYLGEAKNNNSNYFGLTIVKNDGTVVLHTKDDGTLWLKEKISIGEVNIGDQTYPYAFIASQDSIGQDGTITTLEGPVFAAGPITDIAEGFDPNNRLHYNFSVDAQGRMIARDTFIMGDIKIDGDIAANNGIIRKRITIGGNGYWDENGKWQIDLDNSLNWIDGEDSDYAISFSNKIKSISSDIALIDENNTEDGSQGEENTDSFEKIFYITPGGHLFAKDAEIEGNGSFKGEIFAESGSFKGEIHADRGSIDGEINIGDQRDNFKFVLSGIANAQDRIYVGEENSPVFSVSNNGTVYAKNITIGQDGSIEDFLMIGNKAAWINPDKLQNSNYTFLVGYKENDLKQELQKLKDYTITEIEQIEESNNTILYNSNFLIDTHGSLIIKGNNNKIYGSLEIPEPQIEENDTNSRYLKVGNIYLTTVANDINGIGQIYAEREDGTKSWLISDNGSAQFENAYINGSLHAVRFVYNEVATSSGTILIRPSSEIVKIEKIPENIAGSFYGDESLFKYIITLKDDVAPAKNKDFLNDSDNNSNPSNELREYIMIQSSQNCISGESFNSSKYYSFIVGRPVSTVTDENGEVVSKILYNQVVVSDFYDIDLTLENKIDSENLNNHLVSFIEEGNNSLNALSFNAFKGGTYVTFGDEDSTGIVINAMNRKIFGEKNSITFYKNKNSDIKDSSGNSLLSYYNREAKLVLGDLSDLAINDYFVNGDENFSYYGLYADNVFLKGSLISQGVTDTNNFTAGITSKGKTIQNTNNELYEGYINNSRIVFWAGLKEEDFINDTTRTKASFFVTENGFVMAQNGYFKGTIETTNAKISGRIMNDGLLIDGHSKGIAFIATDSDIKNNDNISTFINNEGINLLSGADLKIYKDNYTEEEFKENNNIINNYTPYIFSNDNTSSLVAFNFSTYNYDSDGLIINNNSIIYKTNNFINDSYENFFDTNSIVGLNFNNECIQVIGTNTLDENLSTKLYNNKLFSYNVEVKNNIKIGNQIELGEKAIFEQKENGFDIKIIE